MATCQHPHCDKSIADDRFACKKHWYKLSIALRTRIWTSYANGDIDQLVNDLEDAQEYWSER